MKKNASKRVISAFLAFVMLFLMIPFSVLPIAAENTDYSVPSVGHSLLASYNVLQGTDINSGEAMGSLDIFNREKLDGLYDKYGSLDRNISNQSHKEITGETMSEFTRNAGFSTQISVGANVGIDKIFKVSASEKFGLSGSSSYSESLETYFYEYVVTAEKGFYRFSDEGVDQIKDFSTGYLSDGFILALTGEDGSTPEEFFAKYGTHLITAYTAGGMAGVYSSTIKNKNSLGGSVAVEYENSINGSGTVEGIQLGGDAALKVKVDIDGKSSDYGWETKSDTYAYGGDDAVCFAGGKFEYDEWYSSIDVESNAAILVDEKLELIPLWELLPPTGYEDRVLELLMHFMKMSELQDMNFCQEFDLDYSTGWLNFDNCKIITDEQSLNSVRDDLNGIYVLANDIVLSECADWNPIGTYEEPFTGRFYGNNNTISGLNMFANIPADTSKKGFVGLFGYNDGLITDLKISGNIVIPEINTTNVYIGAIAAYNEGIINNCFDEVSYDIENSSIECFKFPIECQTVKADETYYVGSELGIHLVGQAGTTYSNVNIVVEESTNVGPVYIILEDVNIIGNSSNGTIYNSTSRPIYLISLGTSNTIKGMADAPGINTSNSNLHIFGTAELNVFGGNGKEGIEPSSAVGVRAQTGENGHNGAHAIQASCLYANISSLKAVGGDGGVGGKGGYGDSDGEHAGFGGNGGTGGDGGNAIFAQTVQLNGDYIELIGGNGGKGGNGNYGELGPKCIDGDGGSGGNGGNGNYAIDLTTQLSIVGHYKIVNGIKGDGGAGGYGHKDKGAFSSSYEEQAPNGNPGNDFSPIAEICVGNKRYVLHDTTKTWTDAQASAESNGAYLVTITSESEQNIINELTSYGNLDAYYIGAYRAENDANVWAWVTGEEFSFTNWNSGEPNNSGGSEDYVGIYKVKLAWNDYPGGEAYGYIEEYDLNLDVDSIKDCFTGIVVGCNSDEGKIHNSNEAVWNYNVLEIKYVTDTEYYDTQSFATSTVGAYVDGKEMSCRISYDFRFSDSRLVRMEAVEFKYLDEFEGVHTRYIPVHLKKNTPQDIVLLKPGKTEFIKNEKFDISGISVKIIYLDGSEVAVDHTDSNLIYTTPALDTNEKTETVTVTYLGLPSNKFVQYEVKTEEDTIERIEIDNKTDIIKNYTQGATLDFDDIVIREFRKSGQNGIVDHKYLTYEISPSMCNIGECTVTIYDLRTENVSVSYTITVTENKNFEHSWDNGTVTTEPTHTAVGVMTYQCTVENCDATKTETIPVLEGHTFGDWYKLNETQHQRMCACGDTIVLDHVWDLGITVSPATHLTEGESLHTCDFCNATETRVIEKTSAHSFSDWSSYDNIQHSHVCECGETEYKEHNWDTGTVTTEPTYTTTGLVIYTCGDCKATTTEVIPVLEIPGNAPWIVVDTKNAVIGSTVTVKIGLTNNPGVTSMRINVAYDSALLTLAEVKYNTAMGGQTVLPENIEALNGNVVLYWADGFANYEGDDVFATLTFKVSDSAVVDTMTTIAVTYDAEDIYDADESNVTFFCDDGEIKLIDYIPGDINSDGVVNTKDTTRLMRYLADWDVEINEAALDVNGDGVVNTKDTTRLMRYLAGWDVEIY